MEDPRRPRSEGPYSPRHSTGGLLGSRPARLVAAGLTVSLGVVGAVVITGHDDERAPAVQAAPGLPTAQSSSPSSGPSSAPSPSLPAPAAAGATASAAPPTPRVVDQAPAPAGTAVVGRARADDTGTAQSSRNSTDSGNSGNSGNPGDSRQSAGRAVPEPARPVTPAPLAPAAPPAPEVPPVVAPAERLVLTVSVGVPGRVQVPPQSLQIHLPGPDPVEVTGSVTSPEPGRVDVGVTVDPGPRHVVEDPAPETAGVLAAALQRVARHAAAPAGQTPVAP
ncbi:hypothetical protein [Kineococcus rhizosphaerae]|uniref:Uncharacterized protein n=1 Tax=Kineococcus rhizosphaerae TaxID=559628 RepID=A0A2T0RBF5_9ACTN|nr:hypothetical protein [Kineococcus rhizosphaerae]PRY18506.1 hypothetical protein CLV37_101751 [Kineococcus rhizosphaerae]